MKLKSTIVIPTYNRPHHIEKLIAYIVNNFFLTAVRVLVLDGSDTVNEKVNRQICEAGRVEHISYGDELPYAQRLLAGLKEVSTETVVILGDDDILDPAGFADCVRFLHDNPDYTIAHGQYIRFQLEPSRFTFNQTYASSSIEDKSALNRLFLFFASYTAPTFYAVNRTALLIKIFEEMVKNEFKVHDYLMSELMVSAIPLLNGKLKRLPSFFQARRFEPMSEETYIVVAKYMMKDDFSCKLQKLKHSLLKNMPDQDKIKKETIFDAMDLAFASFFGQRIKPEEINHCFQNLNVNC